MSLSGDKEQLLIQVQRLNHALEESKKAEKDAVSREKLLEQLEEERLLRVKAEERAAHWEGEAAAMKDRFTKEGRKADEAYREMAAEFERLKEKLRTRGKELALKEQKLEETRAEKERLSEELTYVKSLAKEEKDRVQHMLQEHANMQKELKQAKRIIPEPPRREITLGIGPGPRDSMLSEKKDLEEELSKVLGRRQTLEDKKLRMQI